MVTLDNLDKVLTGFEGDSLKDTKNTELTVRKVLVSELGAYNGQKISGDALMKAYDLGIKIHNAKDSIDLESDSVKFIVTVCTENPLYFAVVMGQVLKYIEEAQLEEKAKEKRAKEAKEASDNKTTQPPTASAKPTHDV